MQRVCEERASLHRDARASLLRLTECACESAGGDGHHTLGMGARDDVHAKGWDPTKDCALVPRTLGRAASWATSGWHFVRCAMDTLAPRQTRNSYCRTCAKLQSSHPTSPAFPVSQSVSYFTVPPRAHPSTGSQSSSATPGRTQVPSTRSTAPGDSSIYFRGSQHTSDTSRYISNMYLDCLSGYMYPTCIPHVSCISDTCLSGCI